MEAQRFPDDFDGIVSGAPVYDWTQALAAAIKNAQADVSGSRGRCKRPSSPSTISSSLQQGRARRVRREGRRAPTGSSTIRVRAAFDLRGIKRCAGDGRGRLPDRCAERRHRARLRTAARRQRPRLRRAARRRGSGRRRLAHVDHRLQRAHRGFVTAVPTLSWGFGTQFFKYFVFADPTWDYSRLRRRRELASRHAESRRRSSNADNPDLSAFRARKGKLLLWHGWADPALNPLATIRYYDRVIAKDPGAADDVRLFMLPGVLHCAGGPGPDQVDRLAADRRLGGEGTGARASGRHQAHRDGRRPHASALRLSGARRLQGVGLHGRRRELHLPALSAAT